MFKSQCKRPFCHKSTYIRNSKCSKCISKKRSLLVSSPISKPKQPTNRGRPRKKTNTPYNFSLRELFDHPSLIQTLDLFSEIPSLLLQEIAKIAKSNKETQRKALELWMEEKASENQGLQKGELQNRMPIERMNPERKYNDFMKVVIERTKISLGLKKEAAGLFDDINDLFLQQYGRKVQQYNPNIHKVIWDSLAKHWGTKLEKYFPLDRSFFDNMVNALIEWWKIYFEKFMDKERRQEKRKENYSRF